MPGQARHLLLGLLLVLYGAISLGGPALHALPGETHGKVAPAEGDAGSGDPTSHDCPICHVLAHTPLPGDTAHVLSLDVVRVRPADDLPLVFPPAVDRPAAPRAPPCA